MNKQNHSCTHHCVLGNIFSEAYDKSFIESYPVKKQQRKAEGKVVIYTAKAITTMNEMYPEAEAIAIQGKLIYAVGCLDDIEKSLQLKNIAYDINEDFKAQYFYPGFIESHCHASMEALYHYFVYVGGYARENSAGEMMPALRTNQAVIEKLKSVTSTSDGLLLAWGYDPTVLQTDESALTADDLDQVSQNKPVIVMNMSGHIAYANHTALEMMKYNDQTHKSGVVKENGKLTGELQELSAMAPLLSKLSISEQRLTDGLQAFAKIAHQKGVTTVTDLGLGLFPGAWKALINATNISDFPVKISVYLMHQAYQSLGGVDAFYKAKESENDKLKLSGVKVVSDGSIQGYTAYMLWPYYYDKEEEGLKNIELDAYAIKLLQELVQHDIQAAIHTNGDAAIEGVLDCIEHVMRFTPDRDPRFRLEHCQTVNEKQLSKMKKYNVMANFFINHIYYWGDFHKKHTLGPIRINHMNPLASAKKHGVTFALHSDSPITAINPLRMIQTAAERKSISGDLLGESECISVYDALKAVTKDAAYLLREEDKKGTLETGKLADITILKHNIAETPVNQIADIPVVGTIVSGEIFPATTEEALMQFHKHRKKSTVQ